MFIRKFKQLGPKLFFQKLLGYEVAFSCAIRKKSQKLLYEKALSRPFDVMPQSNDYWYADPLMYEYNKKTYVFMEAFSYKKQKGEIVCAEIIDGRFGDINTVIEEPFHMSFPNVFEYDGDIYMIPETEESNGINVYKCLGFPYEWEKISFIPASIPVVDAIIESIENNIIYMSASTFEHNTPKISKYVYFSIDMLDFNKINFDELKNSDNQYSYENRNAGRYILLNDHDAICCTQTSTKAIYGYSLKFIKSKKKKQYWEKEKKKSVEILPIEVKLKNFKKKIIGVHTYSDSPDYEMIDIEYLRWDFINFIKKVKNNVSKIF